MWQPRESPVRHCGDRQSEIIAELSAEIQKPQKCAEGGDQCLRGRRPALAGPFQKKVSNSLCIPLADILSESAEQICGTAGVLPESRFLHAAMGSEPVAELGHEGRFWGQRLN
jgi:hypothetical protein